MKSKQTEITNRDSSAQRPTFREIKTLEEFNRYYWYRSELADICRRLGINNSGYKQDLLERIRLHFGGVDVPPSQPRQRISPPQVSLEEISLDTPLLACGFAFNKQFRAVFTRLVGGVDDFKFSADMAAAWRKVKETQDDKFTVGDLLEVRKGGSNYARYDSKACQWNKFLHDFCTDKEVSRQFSRPLKAAAALWKIVREGTGRKEYARRLATENMTLLAQYRNDKK